MSESEPLLSVEDLAVHYPVIEGWLRREIARVRAVDGVSFTLDRGETLGIVGESGCGKTTLAHALLRLEEPTGGAVRFDGSSVFDRSGDDLAAFRRRAQLVVQDPNDALNPRITVGEAVAEPLAIHGLDDGDRRAAIAADLLERVGLSASDADRYPHEFSGGEKQRISIARALVTNPDLIVADEPTSALDARVRSEILDLLDDIRREHEVSIVFISHDLDVVERFCDRIAVMYLGEIVERGPTDRVLDDPDHPYTRVLLSSIPSLNPRDRELGRPLTDAVPEPADPPSGCRFHTRCPAVIADPELDLDAETWQRLARFRFTVQAGELPPAVAAEKGLTPEAVRRTFDLPESVGDEAVREGIDRAVDALAVGRSERAVAILAETLPTPCERRAPATTDREEGRSVACLRYGTDVDAEP